MLNEVHVRELQNIGDNRGSYFRIPIELFSSIAAIKDIHIAEIVPGAIRGNHYHEHHHEVLFVAFYDRWSFYWDKMLSGEIVRKSFTGSGIIMLEIAPRVPHAVRNDGNSNLFLIALADTCFTPENPDVHPLKII